jgi:hypothetical protein
MRAHVLIIGPSCLPCITALAAASLRPPPAIVIIDDQHEDAYGHAKHRLECFRSEATITLEMKKLTATAAEVMKPPASILSNREHRRQKQPFYRGLNKYRKP